MLDVGGQIAQGAEFEEIGYQALLGSLPSASAAQILEDPNIRLLQLEEIMFLRPAGQSIGPVPDSPPIPFENQEEVGPLPAGPPLIGLLDGLPLANHPFLSGRLIVDDPQDLEQDYQAEERIHGTAMASLIIRGDLLSSEPPLSSPLYVRPIMRPDGRDFRRPRVEAMPVNQLAVDLLHTAVRRLYEGDGATPAVAPTIRVLNLSIGDPHRPLEGPISSLGRMIDWLSWRYRVIFLVSVGNDGSRIELDLARDAVAQLTPEDLSSAISRSIHAKAHLKRILSPSEAINAITVGSLHADDFDSEFPTALIDPFPDGGYPSPLNRLGLGFKRAVKPDVLFEGGVQLYRLNPAGTNGILETASTLRTGPGQLVAAPGTAAMLRSVRYTCGSSNATAIGSRASALILEMLNSLPAQWNAASLAVLTKVLLVHGSSWTEAAVALQRSLNLGEDYRDHIARYLGYGAVQLERVLSCNQHRVTVIGSEEIGNDEGHVYEFPLPPSLSGIVGMRRLTVSLAWLTPINPQHRDYRRASLWISKPSGPLHTERMHADWQTVQRGTVQHEIFEGEAAVAFIDGATVRLKVNCRADAGRLDDRIPYALAVTLETAEDLRLHVYQEVSERVTLRGEVRV